ncbi:MAG: hypothetical protein ACM3US_02460 [Sphingomonadaceae bacterium]
MLELIYQYTALVVKLEGEFALEGDTAVPLPKEPGKKLVTW